MTASMTAAMTAGWIAGVGLCTGLGASACSSASTARVGAPADNLVPGDDAFSRRARLLAELQDDVLTSYERDEPPDLDTGLIDPRVGTARIGAGPGDVYIAGDLAHAPSRWPLEIDRATQTEARSKRLDIQLAADLTAAWLSDEVSWRIEMCGRTAVIPLRITSLYAREGDRWVPVFEHLSFGWAPAPLDAPQPKAIKTEVVSGDLRDELSGVLGRGLLRVPHDPSVVARDPSALVLGADIADEWHGPSVMEARVPAGRLEDRRVGTVGRVAGDATIAYWVGNYTADIPARPDVAAGKVRMRVTHVFEKRPLLAPERPSGAPRSCARDPVTRKAPPDCRWLLVQSHMSQPITDEQLTAQVFGSALISAAPLRLDCSDGTRALRATVPPAVAPAATPRRTSPPPATAPRRTSPPPAAAPRQAAPPPATAPAVAPRRTTPPPATRTP